MIVGNKLKTEDIWSIVENNDPVAIDNETRNKVNDCFSFLESFSKDKVIYGINTGFGPMAQWRIDDNHLNELQYNIIRSHSTGAFWCKYSDMRSSASSIVEYILLSHSTVVLEHQEIWFNWPILHSL